MAGIAPCNPSAYPTSLWVDAGDRVTHEAVTEGWGAGEVGWGEFTNPNIVVKESTV
jgi:hypothetical protein